MRKLWTEERVTFEGQYYKTLKATLYDRPAKPIPEYVARLGPTVAKMAGELADGYICTSGKAKELYTETLLPNSRLASLRPDDHPLGRSDDRNEGLVRHGSQQGADRYEELGGACAFSRGEDDA